jgi:peroxiredoxin
MAHRLMLTALVVGSIALGITYAGARFRAEIGPVLEPEPTIIISSAGSHKVTPEMLATTTAMAKQVAPAFRAEGSDGKTYALAEMANDGPMALLFIKDGCPCSVAAGPFYNRLHEAYGSRVRFFGVIDEDVGVARRWARAQRVAFPILGDPELKIVHEYKAENSAYFAIISPGGRIGRYWPGYSAEMLKEANAHLAGLAGVEAKPVDVTDAPAEMYSGCPY